MSFFLHNLCRQRAVRRAVCRAALVPLLAGVVALLTGCGSAARTASAPVKTADDAETMETCVLTADEQARYDALFFEAIRYKERGDNAEAYELLRTALAIDPTAPEALFEMGQILVTYAAYGDTATYQRGLDCMRQAALRDSFHTDISEQLAACYARSGAYDRAIDIYRHLTAHRPKPAMLIKMAGIQEQATDYTGAIASIEQYEALQGRDENTSLVKFRLYSRMNDYSRAYAAIEDLYTENPDNLAYRVLLGDLYMQNGCKEMALAVYHDVLAVQPDNAEAQLSLAEYYRHEGPDSLYHVALRRVVHNDIIGTADKANALLRLAQRQPETAADSTLFMQLCAYALAKRQTEPDIAIVYFSYLKASGADDMRLARAGEKVLEADPEDDATRLQTLLTYYHHERYHEVVRLCRDGCLYSPDDIVYPHLLSITYTMLDSLDAAEAVLAEATGRLSDDDDPDVASEMLCNYADLIHKKGRREEAYALYDRALEYNPDNVLCLNNYAYFLSQDGLHLDRAAEMSMRTIEAEPGNAVYLDTYAWILYLKKDYAGARKYIDMALHDLPETAENATIFGHAGDIYYRCSQRQEALKQWVKALSLTTDAKERRELQRKVRTRRP